MQEKEEHRGQLSIVLTGCASGIGLQVMDYLIQKGDIVYGIDKTPLTDLETKYGKEKRQLAGQKGFGRFFQGDVTNEEELKGIAKLISEESIHVVINCAGLIRLGPLIEIEEQLLRQTIEVTVIGTFLVNKVFFPLLRKALTEKNRSFLPRIVVISSEVALVPHLPQPLNGPYSMSKICLESYAVNLRVELEQFGIKVVVINSGPLLTPLLASLQNPKILKKDSLYEKQLSILSRSTDLYVKFFAKKPETIAPVFYHMAHSTDPWRRYKFNVSLVTRFCAMMPHWISHKLVTWLFTMK